MPWNQSPTWTWGCDQGQNSTVPEYAHVAYLIKGNGAYSNMVANILPTDSTLIPGVGSKGQHILFWLHNKLKGMEYTATW